MEHDRCQVANLSPSFLASAAIRQRCTNYCAQQRLALMRIDPIGYNFKMHFSTENTFALQLDSQDELAPFRTEFEISDPDIVYLDGNSLGRLPRSSIPYLSQVVEQEWGEKLIRSWNEGWVDLPQTLGDELAPLIGASAGEVIIADSTSVNLFKLAHAALLARPGRHTVISDTLNFPSDLYILQGLIALLGNRHTLKLVPSTNDISVSHSELEGMIDDDTALVCLTHVAFKSSFMYDLEKVTRAAHSAGALVLWDLSHSVGAVPIDLNRAKADLAVGCTYKYLNGGPGAPAFLFVRSGLQDKLQQPIWGWFGDQTPFAFDLTYHPAQGISRFRSGTPPILSLKMIKPALDLLKRAGIDKLRQKSILQSQYMVYLAENWLYSLGFTLGSPVDPEQRGSHISLRHPEAFRINRALIEAPPPAIRVIPDFRSPDNLRLGIAPIYTSFTDIYRAMRRLQEIVITKEYQKYSTTQSKVT